jgi:2-keto-4-pentenoate hydratase/2-oxohepta-3-ene-1,7-dioic acid hydratase in catechol pathway
VAHQRDLRSNHLPVLSGALAGQQLKRLAIFSRQFDRLRLSSSTHASKLISTFTIMKAIYRMLYWLIPRDPSIPQWARAKSFDGLSALDPVIETKFDAAGASPRTLVDGRERQNDALSEVIFGPSELVSRLSRDRTPEVSDVILCGTSISVLSMKPGATVDLQIDGIGRLRNVYG